MASLRTLQIDIESRDFEAADIQVEKMEGREHISQLFQFDLTVVMRNGAELPAGAKPGAPITLALSRKTNDSSDLELRKIHGIIGAVRDRMDTDRQRRTYAIRVVPQLSTLRLVSIQEVFLTSKVVGVIEHKLDLHDLAGDRLTFHVDDWPEREFIVQYKETDLAFVSRLAEHLGISFVFDHGDDGPEKLVFTDDPARRGIGDLIEEVAYRTDGQAEDVFELEVEREQFPSTYGVQDYNYRHPLNDIAAVHTLEQDGETLGNGGGVIEYGTHHKTKEEGERFAKMRAEEWVAGTETYFGKSNVLALTAGACPKLTEHPYIDGKRLLIVEVEHSVVAGAYTNRFRAIDSAHRYRPPRSTPRPRIYGLVTGTVAVGTNAPVGGRAQIDDEGRYNIQIHFDAAVREGHERASHPIRMAQPFAGPNHGFHFPLRPGTEVVIAFLDGDPDRPIIVGSVPNATNRSSVTLKNSHANRIESATGIVLQFSENK
ncbi:MAG: type VI secretion system tip protein TssI/VgrG [Polyangiaceae bacterium]